MAGLVSVRSLTGQEGQKLQRIVRRGSTCTVRFRRAMMVLASAGGSTVQVIANLVQADDDRPGCDPSLQRDRAGLPGPSVGVRSSLPALR